MRDSTAFKTRLYIGVPARLDLVVGLSGLLAQVKALLGPDGLGGIMVAPDAAGLGLLSGLLALLKAFFRALL
jgi:hypothetical protein